MELIVFIAVIIAFSRAAKAVSRSRFSWGSFGGVVYMGSFVLIKMAFHQIPTLNSKYLFILGALEILVSNALALLVVSYFGRKVFGKNPIDFVRLARILNNVWLIGIVFLLFSSISLVISGVRPASYFDVGLAISITIPALTMFIYRRKSKGADINPFVIIGTIAANIITAIAGVFYVLTLQVSHPIAFPLVETYYLLWLAITTCMNVFALRRSNSLSSKLNA